MKESSDPGAWHEIADRDLRMAETALSVADPMPDMACYHAQQCAEKYLKGYLCSHSIHFERVHLLAYLVGLCQKANREFAMLLDPAAELQDYASRVRYPYDAATMPTPDHARAAIERATAIRDFVLARIRTAGSKEGVTP